MTIFSLATYPNDITLENIADTTPLVMMSSSRPPALLWKYQ